jgi:hypothetical protein
VPTAPLLADVPVALHWRHGHRCESWGTLGRHEPTALHWAQARCCHICIRTGLTLAHICIRIGLNAATSAPGLNAAILRKWLALPHLRLSHARAPTHTCAGAHTRARVHARTHARARTHTLKPCRAAWSALPPLSAMVGVCRGYHARMLQHFILHVARVMLHVARYTSPVVCGLRSPFHRNAFVSCSSDARVRVHSMLIPEPVLSLEPSTGTAGLPARMGYRGAGADGIPCRMASARCCYQGSRCSCRGCSSSGLARPTPAPGLGSPRWRASAPGLGLAPDNGTDADMRGAAQHRHRGGRTGDVCS